MAPSSQWYAFKADGPYYDQSSAVPAPTETSTSKPAHAATETPAAGSTCTSESTYCPDDLPFDTSFQPYGCTLSSFSLSYLMAMS